MDPSARKASLTGWAHTRGNRPEDDPLPHARSVLAALLLAAAVAAVTWEVEWHMGLLGTLDHVLGGLLVLAVAVFLAVAAMTAREIVRKVPFPRPSLPASAGQPGWPDESAPIR